MDFRLLDVSARFHWLCDEKGDGRKTFLFQSNLQLAHNGVVGAFLEALSFCQKLTSHRMVSFEILQISALVHILQLHAAILVEPVLQTGNHLVLIHVFLHVVVEEVV